METLLPTNSSEVHSASLPCTAALTNTVPSSSSSEESSFSISHNVLTDHNNAININNNDNSDNNIIATLDKYERADKAPVSVNEGVISETDTSKEAVQSLPHHTPTNISHKEHVNIICNDKKQIADNECTDYRKAQEQNNNENKNCDRKSVITRKNKPKQNSEHSLLSSSSCDISLLSPALRLLHEVTYERIAHLATTSFSAKRANEFTLTQNVYPALSRMFNLLVFLCKKTMRANKIAADRAKEDERCVMLYEHAAQWKEKKNKTNAALLEKEHAAEMQECTFTPYITEVARRRGSNITNNYFYDGDGNKNKLTNQNKEKNLSARAQQAFMEKCLQWQHAVQVKLKQRQLAEEKEEAERIAKERATRLRRIRAWTSHKERNTPHLSWTEDVFDQSGNDNKNNFVDTTTPNYIANTNNNNNLDNSNRALFLPATATTTKTAIKNPSLEELADQFANVTNQVEDTKNQNEKELFNMEQLPQEQTNNKSELQIHHSLKEHHQQEEEEEEEESECNLYHEEDCHIPITSRSERSAREYLHQLSRSANKAIHSPTSMKLIRNLSPRSQTKDMPTSTTKTRKVQMPTQISRNTSANHSHQPRRTLRQFLNDVANDKSKREMHVKELQEYQNKERNVVHLSDNMLSPLFVPNALPAFRTEDGRVVEYDHLDFFEKERARALLRQHHLEYLITRHELEQAKRLYARKHTDQEHHTLDENKSNITATDKHLNNHNEDNVKTNDNIDTSGKNDSNTITENYKLSKSKMLELVERLEAHQAAKQARLQALEEHIQQEECSFQPKITHKSQRLAKRKNGNVPIYKRANVQAWHRYPFSSVQHEESTKEENRVREVGSCELSSMASNYNDDVVNRSHNNNNDRKIGMKSKYNKNHEHGVDDQLQSKQINTERETPNNIHASHQITEKINDMLTRSSLWNERRLQRIRLARAEQEAAQLVECTFKPQRLEIHNGAGVNRTRFLINNQNGNIIINNPMHEQEHEYYHNRSSKHHKANDDYDDNDYDYDVDNYYRNSQHWMHHSQERQGNHCYRKNRNKHYKNVNSGSSRRSSYIDEIAHVSPELSYNSTELQFTPLDNSANNRFNGKGHKNEFERQKEFKSPIKEVQLRQDALATAANIRVMQELEMLQNELVYHKDCVLCQMSKERNKSNKLNTSHSYDKVVQDATTLSQNDERDLLHNKEKYEQHNENYRDINDIDVDDDDDDDDDSMKYRINNYINDSNDDSNYRMHNETIEENYNIDNKINHDNIINDNIDNVDMGVLNDEEDMWDELDDETDAIISMLEQKSYH